jgi:ribosomal-protein-alanine N-acetyltransferase
MKKQPVLKTQRLILRPFCLDDSTEVKRLAGERVIAENTFSIPHPYKNGVAEEWISKHQNQFAKNEAVVLAITLAETKTLIGAVSLLNIYQEHENAELGYWIGEPYWQKGYCTEAVKAILNFGFESLKMHRIYAVHYAENIASGRVLLKSGMKHEGLIHHSVKKWGEFKDLELYVIVN